LESNVVNVLPWLSLMEYLPLIMTRIFFAEGGNENSLPKATSASMNFALPSLASQGKKKLRTEQAPAPTGEPSGKEGESTRVQTFWPLLP
jgi:hypothetical protein